MKNRMLNMENTNAKRKIKDMKHNVKSELIPVYHETCINHELKEVWEQVRYLINENKLEIVPIEQKNGKIINKNNLPSSKFNALGHLRPGGVNGDDKVKLPTGQSIVKQRFWFNTEYIKEILDL